MRRGPPSRGDDGYAMVAAVAAIAAFSYIALEVMAQGRGVVAGIDAQMTKARLTAAADAGVIMGVHGVGLDRAGRWPIDGRVRRERFAGADLAIRIEDERGKIPLNDVDEDQARRMFAAAGAVEADLDAVTDAFLDWRDDDDEPRGHGAEAEAYAPGAARPRNGALATVSELRAVRGVTPELYARLKPAVTVFFGRSGGFSRRTASPFALTVMLPGGEASPDIIERERELEGDRPALDIADDTEMKGRAFTVHVTASDGRGGQATRSAVVELTGDPAEPYWVRSLD